MSFATVSFGAGVIAAVSLSAGAANAASLSTLHTFMGKKDGGNPHGQLVEANGLLYGTAEAGGAHGDGAVFSIDPTSGNEVTVYSFKGGKDGSQPIGGLALQNNLLYGVTQAGGRAGVGTLFSVDPATGAEKVVYTFFGNTGDGAQPSGGPILANGILYGATWSGGTDGGGTVYSVDPTKGKETILRDFGAVGSGQNPTGALLYYNSTLYGVTSNGGAAKHEESGTIFSVGPAGGGATLYSFGQPGSDNNDGINPWSGLVLSGNVFYGTTYTGGADHCGTIYSFDPASNTETVAYEFTCGPDGGYPFPALIADGGMLYGATSFGGGGNCGGSGCGAVYSFSPGTNAVTSLYTFKTGSNGGNPEAELLAVEGTLYGTTFDAGKKNEGTVFSLPE